MYKHTIPVILFYLSKFPNSKFQIPKSRPSENRRRITHPAQFSPTPPHTRHDTRASSQRDGEAARERDKEQTERKR
ncbi:hypothetical protein FRC18_005961, partial [Serendipita sp. 400]